MKARLNALMVVALLLSACTATTIDPTPTPIPTPAAGHDFGIHLQEGFTGDDILIRVDGALVYQGAPETNPVLGLAETFGARAAGRMFALTVEVPAQQIDHTQTLNPDDGLAVGISLYQEEVLVIQANWFGYE
jgi:hypothetical protein